MPHSPDALLFDTQGEYSFVLYLICRELLELFSYVSFTLQRFPDSPPNSSRVCPAASCGLNNVTTSSSMSAAATSLAVTSTTFTTGAVCSSAMYQGNREVNTTRVIQASRQVFDSSADTQPIVMSKDRAARYQECVAGIRKKRTVILHKLHIDFLPRMTTPNAASCYRVSVC